VRLRERATVETAAYTGGANGGQSAGGGPLRGGAMRLMMRRMTLARGLSEK